MNNHNTKSLHFLDTLKYNLVQYLCYIRIFGILVIYMLTSRQLGPGDADAVARIVVV